ncbi:pilus assembly protein TadG-related protein [Hyphobacterium sp. SN044]|uniref:pilus assembly protein TadG-related protein n=1 Tax=Hyphobacterium sp. SN044 TaxID=2912575 RepID=UPI001F2BFA2B|nr:pilus assembly protein TadG-related protein [Hyphobacterium sp. SN044]MCF8880622.1 pilus assembly protein TadG-related protein [Hyphobacterium sp. SN044]
MFGGFVKRFARRAHGNVAMVFALMVTPMTLFSGAAVDFHQAMNARARLAEALDAAALAVGASPYISEDTAEQLAADFIAANFPARTIGRVGSVHVAFDTAADAVRVSGQAIVETDFLRLMGIKTLTVEWESEVVRARQNLELVMVLDNTGSMSGSKITALRDAARLMTSILFENASDSDRLAIGLVPFSSTVNVGNEHARAWWLDPDAQNPDHSAHFAPAANRWDLFDTLQGASWRGCVEARRVPLDIEDVAPDPADPETLFLPYFAPDEPSGYSNFANSYLSDQTSSTNLLTRQTNTAKYWGRDPYGDGPNWGCTARPITPLTSHRSTIDNAINAMIASGTTNIPIGVSWGVRVLSPQAPFTEGAPFNDRETIKAMVILTDGENVLNGRSNINYSDYSGYGYVREGRLGVMTSSDSALSNALDERTAAACAYARQQGIRVYTITFQVSSATTRDMMRDCATHPSLYFDSPSNEALRDAFELIAGDLTNLRLSQ